MNLLIRLQTLGGMYVSVHTGGKSSPFPELACVSFLQNYTSRLMKQKDLLVEGEIFNLLKVNASL